MFNTYDLINEYIDMTPWSVTGTIHVIWSSHCHVYERICQECFNHSHIGKFFNVSLRNTNRNKYGNGILSLTVMTQKELHTVGVRINVPNR